MGGDVSKSPGFYTAYGMKFRSEFELPELVPAEGPDFDVEVVEGRVPETLERAITRGVRYELAEGRLLLKVDRVARYLVSDGRSIVVERAEGVSEQDVRVFLFGSALAAMFHQRGDLLLHGSAVVSGGEGVAFVGHSGQGKSTLAAARGREDPDGKGQHGAVSRDRKICGIGGRGRELEAEGTI